MSDDKMLERFANAARVLMYGNGELKDLIQDLANVLAEYDGLEVELKDNKLLQIISYLPLKEYVKFSIPDPTDIYSWNYTRK